MFSRVTHQNAVDMRETEVHSYEQAVGDRLHSSLSIALRLCANPCAGRARRKPRPVPHAGAAQPARAIHKISFGPAGGRGGFKRSYSRINPNTFAVYHPDRELYNALYQAAYAYLPSLDISGFDLTDREKTMSAESLYGACGFELFDLDRVKLSDDHNTVKFRYLDMDENTIAKNRETLFARLSHLENNVVQSGYSEIQKLVAVYQFICENSDYSSDMENYTTFTPYGILVEGQGICGGYALLTQYALTRLGLTAEYVCTEAHAWNIVKVGETRYHTDVTWGAGNEWDTHNNSRYLFMDDSLRRESLINTGYPADPMILGYPGGDRGAPPACT
ncbi:MAG: transglutaminase domain-containing protein, partial [Bacillota bacterium]